jgi:hypothetical protein
MQTTRPPEVAYYDLTEEELEEERRYCEELRERMLEAELRPSIHNFFGRRRRSTLRSF